MDAPVPTISDAEWRSENALSILRALLRKRYAEHPDREPLLDRIDAHLPALWTAFAEVYGDEIGQLNDLSYLNDALKAEDSRWVHRPPMDWARAALRHEEGRVEQRLFDGTRRLLAVSNFSDTPRAVALTRLPGAWG
ncbi:MAG: hypothetical protein BRD30_12025 [Bacteroidetes bacterium QH_2_63_10]|nr:MAG: hypothetical protein BRD30_12025 [Bacteroidetes bacterium QH_2_63_10]